MGFDTRLRMFRQHAELSQVELAEKAGIPLDSIQNWEQGRTRPRLEALTKLASALRVRVDELVADSTTPEQTRPRGRPRKAEGDDPKRSQ